MSGVAAGDIFVRFLPPVLTDSLATLVHSVTSGGTQRAALTGVSTTQIAGRRPKGEHLSNPL